MEIVKKRNLIANAKNYLSLLLVLYSCVIVPLHSAPEKVLRAGVTVVPPYVFFEENEYKGISVDIWAVISTHLGLHYKIIPMSQNILANVEALQRGEIDVLIGPVTATSKRAKLVQFTRPYALNRVGIVVPYVKKTLFSTIITIVATVFSFAMVIAIAVLFIYSNLIWYLERGKLNTIPTTYFSGVSHVLWSSLLKRGISDMPTTLPGRVVHLLWVSTSAIVLSMIYAGMATSFHISFGDTRPYDSESDFTNKRIVALEGGVGHAYAKNAGLNVFTVKDQKTAMNMVLNKEAGGFADYAADSLYYIREHKLSQQLVLAPYILKINILAFALPVGDPLIPKINAELAYMEDYSLVSAICGKYLDKNSAAYCL